LSGVDKVVPPGFTRWLQRRPSRWTTGLFAHGATNPEGKGMAIQSK
jgi:hypothetical protein